MYDDVPSVFVDTGLEYPEIKAFVREINEGKYEPNFRANVEILRPKMRFDEVIKKDGYPVVSKVVAHNIAIAKHKPNGKVAKNIVFNKDRTGLFNQYKWRFLVGAPFNVSDKCCNIMKKKPTHDYEKSTEKKVILGTMATESMTRYSNWLKYGCNSFDGKTKQSSQPLSFWTEQDILHYISYYDLPIAKVYGDVIQDDSGKWVTTGVNRTGCMFCMFGVHLEKEPNRFQRMKETHPKQYDYCMRPVEENGLGLKGVIDWINENSNGKTKILY